MNTKKNKMERPIRKTGFTLIELLVVISIIAMLLSILMPSLSAAKQMAKKVTCMSNIRQMGIITHMYTDDWEGYYPPAWDTSVSPSITWCGEFSTIAGVSYMDVSKSPLWPYMQEKQVMRCTSFKPQVIRFAGSGQISGYGINWAFVAGDWNISGMAGWAKPARVSQITRPTETIIFADSARLMSDNTIREEIALYPRYRLSGSEYSDSYRRTHFRHRQRANAAFCDGHAETIEPEYDLDDGNCSWVDNKFMDRK